MSKTETTRKRTRIAYSVCRIFTRAAFIFFYIPSIYVHTYIVKFFDKNNILAYIVRNQTVTYIGFTDI